MTTDEKIAELASIVDGLIEVVANMNNHVDWDRRPDTKSRNRQLPLDVTHRLARRVTALRREGT